MKDLTILCPLVPWITIIIIIVIMGSSQKSVVESLYWGGTILITYWLIDSIKHWWKYRRDQRFIFRATVGGYNIRIPFCGKSGLRTAMLNDANFLYLALGLLTFAIGGLCYIVTS